MNNNIALITGVTSGIGKEMARELINAGWLVVGIGRDSDMLQNCKIEFGECFFPLQCDVSNPQHIKESCEVLKKSQLLPSLFILNAGIGELEPFVCLDVNIHRKTFDINYFGVLQWIEEWLIICLDVGGTFVAISSVLALYPTATTAYCSSKAAIKSAFNSLRLRYYNTSVKFITVLPGPIKTKMFKSDNHLPFVKDSLTAARYI